MEQATTTRVRKPRRKRVRFKVPPRPAVPVKALWEHASDEERQKAHRVCMGILEYWLGRVRKEDLARQLGVPPIRVWQLSQQALSGMLAGLLRQPRTRRRFTAMPTAPEDDPRVLRKRIAELEDMLDRTEDLVRVLKELPWNKDRDAEKEVEDARRRMRGEGKKRSKAVSRRVSKKSGKMAPGAEESSTG